jgi:hypothetical protein
MEASEATATSLKEQWPGNAEVRAGAVVRRRA